MSGEFRGIPQAIRQSVVKRYDPSSGYVTDYDYEGFNGNDLASLAAQFAQSGCAYTFAYKNGKYTLQATDPRGGAGGSSVEVTIDTWEVALSKLSFHISVHPTVLSIIENSGNPAAVVRGIKQFLDSTEAYEDVTALHPVDGADDATMKAFLNQARNGADTFNASSYILRHTTNVSNRWRVNIADIGIDSIYTTAQLLSETQDQSLWIFPLPGRLNYKLSAISAEFISRWGTHTNRQWGWLKSGSPESSVANNRVNIVTEYEFGEWSTLQYAIL